MFTNLLAPFFAGVNHLLECLGVLLGAVVALENIRCVHCYSCFDDYSAAKIRNIPQTNPFPLGKFSNRHEKRRGR